MEDGIKTGPEIKSGETTSEYAVSRSGSMFGMVVTIAGAILAILPQIISQAQEIPGVADSKYGSLALTVLGGLMSVAGIIVKLANDTSYSQGRALVKAAAARDLPPPPKI